MPLVRIVEVLVLSRLQSVPVRGRTMEMGDLLESNLIKPGQNILAHSLAVIGGVIGYFVANYVVQIAGE